MPNRSNRAPSDHISIPLFSAPLSHCLSPGRHTHMQKFRKNHSSSRVTLNFRASLDLFFPFSVPGFQAVPPFRWRLGQSGGDVLHAVPLQCPPAQLLHPYLALRLHELRQVPPGLVHESGEFPHLRGFAHTHVCLADERMDIQRTDNGIGTCLLSRAFPPLRALLSPYALPMLMLVGWRQDLDMYHAESDTPARVRTMNLNEDLGQV